MEAHGERWRALSQLYRKDMEVVPEGPQTLPAPLSELLCQCVHVECHVLSETEEYSGVEQDTSIMDCSVSGRVREMLS